MPIYRDKARGRLVFEFDRVIAGQRVRARKLLPKAWTQAQADAYDRKESARLYAVGTSVERSEHLIEDAVLVYLKERVPKLKSGAGVEAELCALMPHYKGKALAALPEVCREYARTATRTKDGDARPLTPATIRYRIRCLTAACRYGWKHHAMGEADPAARVVVPEVRNERQTYIGRADMLRLARACTNRGARKVIRIAFYSGMRLGEVLRAEARGDRFVLADTKNGQPRVVPIHPRIAVCARSMPTGMPKITVQRAFQRARALIGLEHVRLHDVRHAAASEMINAGVDLYTVGAVLGHKDPRSTKRYAHLATETLSLAVARIGKRVA